jgi:GR25 family glycosyltransferase involved in LPS biosynthesis
MYILLSILLSILFIQYSSNHNTIARLSSSYNLPIFLVSLEKDHIRRLELYKKVEPQLYYAVDCTLISRDFLDTFLTNKTLTNGEIGCYLSHIYMLEKSLVTKSLHDTILVLEDDAYITNTTSFYSSICDIIKDAPSDLDLIFLGYNYFYTTNSSSTTNSSTTNSSNIITYCTPIDIVYGTHGYLINQKNVTIDKIKTLENISMPIDVRLSRDFKSYIISPPLITLHPTFSQYSNTQSIL